MPHVEKTERGPSARDAPTRSPTRRRPRRGVTAIEYCLLASVVSVVGIVGIQRVGIATNGLFEQVPVALSGQSGGGSQDDGNGDSQDKQDADPQNDQKADTPQQDAPKKDSKPKKDKGKKGSQGKR